MISFCDFLDCDRLLVRDSDDGRYGTIDHPILHKLDNGTVGVSYLVDYGISATAQLVVGI